MLQRMFEYVGGNIYKKMHLQSPAVDVVKIFKNLTSRLFLATYFPYFISISLFKYFKLMDFGVRI